jgi:hypothetical protein
MSNSSLAAAPGNVVLWAPRLLAIGVSLFLGIFALDALTANTPTQALRDFLIHLAPTAILLVIVGLSWRREWIGGVAFIGLAIGYAIMQRAHPSWIAVIAGPLFVAGALYGLSWMRRRAAG